MNEAVYEAVYEAMNESETISREQDVMEHGSPVQNAQQPVAPGNQIANMDYSDYVALLMESRII